MSGAGDGGPGRDGEPPAEPDSTEATGAPGGAGEAPDPSDGTADGSTPGRRGADDLLAEAVDRMAHQIKNPLQAVAMNLEVIRTRLRGRAPELWSELERYGDAVDQNVSTLDRRLRLLLRLGRRAPDGPLESVDVAALAREFAEALRLDEDRPVLSVEAEGPQLTARARPGYVLELLFVLWHAARAGAPDAPELPVTVSAGGGEVLVEARLPPGVDPAGGAGPDGRRDPATGRSRWTTPAKRAGGRLEVQGREDGTRVRLVLPAG